MTLKKDLNKVVLIGKLKPCVTCVISLTQDMIHEQPNVEDETSIHKKITYLMNKIIQSKIPPILNETPLIKICRERKMSCMS